MLNNLIYLSGIIPQLFSRLNHPESYVRGSVSDLLCRLAVDAPHLVLYPAIVGCTKPDFKTEPSKDDLLTGGSSQEEDNGTEEAADQSTDILQNRFTALVSTLSNQNPEMINEVQLLVHELRRITVLWDELWLGTLNQHHQDVSRRLTQLESEVSKVKENTTLTDDQKDLIIKRKHETVLRPTVFTMERLLELTSRQPETEHEKWFQTTYSETIKKSLECLKQPSDPSQPQQSWSKGFKQLHRTLQERAHKKSNLLRMIEISNKLTSLSQTSIPMPGIADTAQVSLINIFVGFNLYLIIRSKHQH